MGWDWDAMVGGALICVVLAVLGLIGVVVWQESKAPTFELAKADWTCTAEHDETHQRPQLVGKVTIMVPYTVTVCDRWERRP